MKLIELLAIVVRWVHLLSAIVAVGGAVFMRIVLMPAAHAALPDDARHALHTRLMARWKRVVHVCVPLLLITGAFNFYSAVRDGVAPFPYHALFGVKFILAAGVFFLAIALSGASPGFARLRAKRKRWTTVLILLAVLAVLVSGVLRWAHLAALSGVEPGR